MSRIDDLIAQHCPDGVEIKTLGEVGEFIRGNGLQKRDFVDDGFPCIHYGQVFTTYGTATSTTKSFVTPALATRLRRAKPGDLVVATTSENDEDVCKAVAWMGETEVAISGDAYIFSHNLDPRYVAYFLQTDDFRYQKARFITGTKLKRVSGAHLAMIKIPVPPSAIQREIARILSKMELLKSELKAELESRSRQYAYYRDSFLAVAASETVTRVNLGVIADVRTGQAPPPDLLIPVSDIPYVNAGTTASGWASRANTEAEAVTIPSRGQGGVGIVGYQATEFWCGPLCYRIRSNRPDVRTRYLYHYLKSIQGSIRGLQQTGGTPALNRKELVLVEVAFPSLDEQERMVAMLEKFDALVNDVSSGLPAEIKTRHQQYEYYRDKLLAFGQGAA